jgi:hypothetical protein
MDRETRNLRYHDVDRVAVGLVRDVHATATLGRLHVNLMTRVNFMRKCEEKTYPLTSP